MRIKEFIQFIELLLNELLQSKRILAFPNESNFGKAKVTTELQRENFIFFYFNTEAQSDRGLIILSPYLGISVFNFFAGDPGSSPG